MESDSVGPVTWDPSLFSGGSRGSCRCIWDAHISHLTAQPRTLGIMMRRDRLSWRPIKTAGKMIHQLGRGSHTPKPTDPTPTMFMQQTLKISFNWTPGKNHKDFPMHDSSSFMSLSFWYKSQHYTQNQHRFLSPVRAWCVRFTWWPTNVTSRAKSHIEDKNLGGPPRFSSFMCCLPNLGR